MRWLSLQRTTFVENVGVTDESGGIIDPNPNPNPDPDPVDGYVVLKCYLTNTPAPDLGRYITLNLPRVIPVDVDVYFAFLSTGITLISFVQIQAYENLSNKTKLYIPPGSTDVSGFTFEFSSVVPETFTHNGINYRFDVSTEIS